MPDQIFNQDIPDLEPLIPFGNLIPIQGGITTPTADDIEVLTGLLAADYRTDERFTHFHESLYDLSENSHLVRFLKALLGDTGAGQLRKRTLVVRLQNALTGSRFYDLDRFYGAIFGAARKIPEVLPVDPMEETATPDEWDEILAADGSFRNRVAMLGRSIAMGGTVPGLTAAAEALTGVDCDLYETWPLIDNYGAGGGSTGRSWDDMETEFPTWDDFVEPITWAEVEDIVLFGRTGTNSRSEFVIRVKKQYDTALERAEDELALIQVLGKLKPASVLMTVDPDGLSLHHPARIAGITSDSDYWEVVPKVSPRVNLGDRWTRLYPHSQVRVKKGLSPERSPRILPRPPMSGTQGRQWSHNTFVSSVRGYTIEDGVENTAENFDRVPNTEEGTVRSFAPAAGLSDSRSLAAAQATGDGITVSHPYTGARQVAKTAT